MEKFRSTSDPSTGLHPFLPSSQPRTLPSQALGYLLIILRAPLFLIVYVCYAIISRTARFVPFPGLSRAIERLTDILLLPPLAISLGLWRYQLPTLEKPRTRVASPGQHPTYGDIVLVNHASPLDALYLALCYSPTFVIPQGADLIQLSTLSAFSQIGCAPKLHGRKVSLDTLRKLKVAPIVIFVEGCTTNGRGVLELAISEDLLSSAGEAYALGLRYSSDTRECCTVDSVWRHVLSMMASLSCKVNGRVQKVSLAKSNVQGAIASLAGVPALRIGRNAGLRFAEHWINMANGSSSKL